MLTLRQMRRNAAGVVVLVLVAAGLVAGIMTPAPSAVRTIPTGASFIISVARSGSDAHARAIAASVEAFGQPAFTRVLNGAIPNDAGADLAGADLTVGPYTEVAHYSEVGPGRSFQVIVGPFAAIDEAERAQRMLGARGFGARLLVDESVRREPGYDGIPTVSAGVNVVLVAGAGRLSVVLEMPSEPKQVHTRRHKGGSSDSPSDVVEVEAGPVLVPVEPQLWNPPLGVKLIERVAIEEVVSATDRSVRTRIAVAGSVRSNVRVVGKRVYIDLWSPPSRARRAFTLRQAVMPQEVTEAPPYEETIRPAVARLRAMEPFVLSAARAPAPDVLAALAGSLQGLQQWIQSVEAPGELAEAHGALIIGVGLAIKAVDPAFHGDRAAQAREAFALLNLQSTPFPPPLPEAQP